MIQFCPEFCRRCVLHYSICRQLVKTQGQQLCIFAASEDVSYHAFAVVPAFLMNSVYAGDDFLSIYGYIGIFKATEAIGASAAEIGGTFAEISQNKLSKMYVHAQKL